MLNRKLKVLSLVLCIVLILSIVSFAQVLQFKVKLNLFERLVVMSLLPTESNFVTLNIIRDLQGNLAPTEEEIKLSGLEAVEGGGVNAKDWNAVPGKEVVFGDIAKGLIIEALKKLDEAKQLKMEQFSVYEKFVLEKEKENK